MSEEENKVSVVLCTYNGSIYIRKQLNSILDQNYSIDEIIIVDDCSADCTRDILNEYKENFKEVKLFFNEENLGPNKSFKYAISLASNSYIALCDQDDIWDKSKIRTQMESVFSFGYNLNSKPLVVFHDLCVIDENDNIRKESFWEIHKFKPNGLTFKKLFMGNIITGCTCLINKSMKDEIVKCDMRNIIMHDHLLALIAYGFGNYIHINKQLIQYRSHSNSVTQKENSSFIKRLTIFALKVTKGDYLLPNILQIEKFNECYSDKLDATNKSLVSSFVSLKNKGVISVIIYRWIMN